MKRLRRCRIPTVFALLIVLGGIAQSREALAYDGRRGATPPRLGFLDGDVSFWRPGAEIWAPAQVNTALAAGDALYAGDGGNFELQIGPRAFVRAGANTELGLESVTPGYLQFKMTGGHAALDLKRLARGQTLEIDTPTAAFTIERAGYYRVDVDDDRTAFSARRGGAVMMVPVKGASAVVGENEQVILTGSENVSVNVTAAPGLDAWDRWNYDRLAQLAEAPQSAQYVPRGVVGVDDLDRYGDWRNEPRYGHVWVPRDVTPDWVPYSTGRWVYDPYYEWTWVDEAPWGWAPYHYGRWVHGNGFWGWAPGPIVGAPVYAPALVAFFGAPGVGVSVRVGLPFVSWVPLGFGEPVIPWWGGARSVGRPSWDGWGGRRVVNNVVINNTTVVNVRNIRQFQNQNVPGAVGGVNREQFGRGRLERVRLDPERTRRLQPVLGRLGVRPVAASLVPKEGRGQPPPERLHGRSVVATRPAQDHTKRLRAKGLDPVAPVAASPSRIVKPRRGSQGGRGERGQPPAGVRAPAAASARDTGSPPPSHGERRQHGSAAPASERAAPPPPSRKERRQPADAGAPGATGEAATGTPPPRSSHGGRRQHGSAAPAPERAAPPAAPRNERRQPTGAGAPGATGESATGTPPPRPSHGERRQHGSAAPAPERAAPPPLSRKERRQPADERAPGPASAPNTRNDQPAHMAPPSSPVAHPRSGHRGEERGAPPPPAQRERSSRGHDVPASRRELAVNVAGGLIVAEGFDEPRG